VPTPPRSRYAAVMTTAVVGAGVVALGAGTAMPDLASDNGFATVEASLELGDFDRGGTDRANRTVRGPASTVDQAAPKVWLLPMKKYTVTSLYGPRWGRQHAGVDLAAPEGTPFHAVAAGRVILSRYNSGYGNNVWIDHGDGIVTVYGHASRLLVKEGQMVQAGERIALVGNTGHSFGAHLHLEVRINNKQVEPIAWLRKHGVDINKRIETIYS
jgi:murein DD-endopeptidase MepM/ murein hydrolase activator NlpD